MKYRVEFKQCRQGFDWEMDEEFSNLADAVEYAAVECINGHSSQHRIVKVYDVEQVMFFPSIEEVTE